MAKERTELLDRDGDVLFAVDVPDVEGGRPQVVIAGGVLFCRDGEGVYREGATYCATTLRASWPKARTKEAVGRVVLG